MRTQIKNLGAIIETRKKEKETHEKSLNYNPMETKLDDTKEICKRVYSYIRDKEIYDQELAKKSGGKKKHIIDQLGDDLFDEEDKKLE